MDAVRFSDALAQEVAELTRQFTRYNRGGFQIHEVLRFVFECTDAMADLGTQYLDVPHNQQKDEVVNALRLIYMGKNPDLPWVGEPFETMIEMALFTYIVPELYSVLFTSKLKKSERSKSTETSEDPLLAQMKKAIETPEGQALMASMPANESGEEETLKGEPQKEESQEDESQSAMEFSPDAEERNEPGSPANPSEA